MKPQHTFRTLSGHRPHLALLHRSGRGRLRTRRLSWPSFTWRATGSATPVPVVPISHSVSALPLYAFYSIVRIGDRVPAQPRSSPSATAISPHTTPRVEAWMIAVLDILQSIPVLSFLPPVLLAMIALIPGHQLGIEMGVILLIFTGQVWNLAFSFYSSLKTIPREMIEASRIYRFSAWQRFWQLEMPYAAIGLVWNSIVSVAGGWFALIALRDGSRSAIATSSLPGLGSYIQIGNRLRRHSRACQRHRHRRPDRRCHRPACLAAADRLERQVQIRAGRVG